MSSKELNMIRDLLDRVAPDELVGVVTDILKSGFSPCSSYKGFRSTEDWIKSMREKLQ
tara:strand:+ start:663 stop:836 length:174 start_codon:yes stop_codon:yes gene_type:complete